LLPTTETPIQLIDDPILKNSGVTLSIKREDLNDPFIQGNKWLKLKPNLQLAKQQGYKKLLTFGGCYSNHIYATAAAGQRFNFETIGIIRGPEPKTYSPTLQFAKQAGMQLHFIDRKTYRTIQDIQVQKELSKPFQPVYIIPEGGSNHLAVDSCTEYIQNIQTDYDILTCACGTGGTLAGLIKGLNGRKKIIGFPVLKGGDFLYADIQSFLTDSSGPKHYDNWALNTDYHFGGYGRSTEQLNDFIVHFYQQHNILLEPVYTGKIIFAVYDLIKKGHFQKNTRILAIHTGGIQGLEGFPELKKRLHLN
jgi:1-aminocyclopropane-1-carboxylate deaminase/D-cysteine desulfhydrase-like pyridoxal-dependent ACC family enzyme